MHAARVLRKEHGSLASGIAAADDDNFLADAELSLHEGSVVVNSLAGKLFKPWDGRLVVLGSDGEHDRACPHRQPVIKSHLVGPLVALKAQDGVGDHDLRAELLRLRDRAVRQFLTRKPRRKAEVVFNL